jgi:hypothetical protein
MTNQHPITPPSELVQQWSVSSPIQHSDESWTYELFIAHQAARWGADQELEACCEWLDDYLLAPKSGQLRAARRPKPPSLKEQALAALGEMSIEPCLINGVDANAAVRAKYNTIRRALEQLND